jgi:phosphopantothenoylcysteine decarboxylase / phosphopantothenate---cysteine ligase
MRPTRKSPAGQSAARRARLKVLITAGPTIEDIDPVRFISNGATGMLGVLLAQAALRSGHGVVLIHGPISEKVRGLIPAAAGEKLRVVEVRSADQMHKAVMKAAPAVDALVMTAGVADFTPVSVAGTKLKKAQSGLTLHLRPTVDIAKKIGQRKSRHGWVLIGFALETGSGRSDAERRASRESEARRKLASKNLDAIVLDTPAEMGAAAGDFTIILRQGHVELHRRCSKVVLARRLVKLAEELYAGAKNGSGSKSGRRGQ